MHIAFPSLLFFFFALYSQHEITLAMSLLEQECADKVTNCPDLENLNCEDPTLKMFCTKTCGLCHEEKDEDTIFQYMDTLSYNDARNRISDGADVKSQKNQFLNQQIEMDYPEEMLRMIYGNQSMPKGRQSGLSRQDAQAHVDFDWIGIPRGISSFFSPQPRCFGQFGRRTMRVALSSNPIQRRDSLMPSNADRSTIFGQCPVSYRIRSLSSNHIPSSIMEVKCQCPGEGCHDTGLQCTQLSKTKFTYIRQDDGSWHSDVVNVGVGCACLDPDQI